ncbi:MAG TPA: hypothetical protein VK975_02465 [Acidimicrobiales bacterium]|nr:hypothetical protein [Acidimicrobiales bacterium]
MAMNPNEEQVQKQAAADHRDEQIDELSEQVERLSKQLRECEQRAAAAGGVVTYELALRTGAEAYRRAFQGIALVAAGGLHAFDQVLARMRAGRLSIIDHEAKNPFGLAVAAEHLGVERAVGRVVSDLEPVLFDRATGLPKVIAVLHDAVKAYADEVCACEGEAVWAEARLLAALEDAREMLVGDWTAMAHLQAHALVAVRAGVGAIVDQLPTCPPPASVGNLVETVALWAGEDPAVARRLDRWFERANEAVEYTLDIIGSNAPTETELVDLGRRFARFTATPSPVRLPLITGNRAPLAAAPPAPSMVHAATTTTKQGSEHYH